MSDILQAQVTIGGTKALLWRVFGPESIPLEKQERSGVAGNDPEEWKRSYTATAEGQLYLDPSCVFASIRDGAKHTRKGRGTMQGLVASTLQVRDERILLDRYMPSGELSRDPLQPVYLDVRGVVNPTTKARGVRYRVAAAPGWRTTFALLWDKTVVSRGELEAALRDGGKLCGIGDGRGVGFGRFVVEVFTVREMSDAA